MTETKVLHLKFKTSSGKALTLAINNPKESISLADATQVANTLVENKVFEGSDKMLLASFEDAEMVSTQTTPLV